MYVWLPLTPSRSIYMSDCLSFLLVVSVTPHCLPVCVFLFLPLFRTVRMPDCPSLLLVVSVCLSASNDLYVSCSVCVVFSVLSVSITLLACLPLHACLSAPLYDGSRYDAYGLLSMLVKRDLWSSTSWWPPSTCTCLYPGSVIVTHFEVMGEFEKL